MSVRIALSHKTSYGYDRAINLSPHEVRLRPAPHTRTPILSYSLSVSTQQHFINWQQDPCGNYIARFVFPEKLKELSFTVNLVADMTTINPFDFFIDQYAQTYPFCYADPLKYELMSYLATEPAGALLEEWLESFKREGWTPGVGITDFLTGINRRIQSGIAYLLRMEPGVQAPEETLRRGYGSCRDSTWLLIQILRHMGLAARFVSGYLVQFTVDGVKKDFVDLHAWAEVYLPGAGWIGLDPTSGLLTSEGHIPLACTALPANAAPVIGSTDIAEGRFDFEMSVTRLDEEPIGI